MQSKERVGRIARSAAITVVILLVAANSWPNAHYYMTIEPGNEKWYVNTLTHEYAWYMHVPGYHENFSIVVWEDLANSIIRAALYSMDPDGDVWIHGTYDPVYMFDEPRLWVDAPLYVGKTWGRVAQDEYDIHDFFRVTGVEDVSTPLGVLTSFLVVNEFGNLNEVEYTWYWYCDGYGLVRFAWECFYCDWTLDEGVIPTESSSWTAVKSLYR